MAVSLYTKATEYVTVPLTITRGAVTDIVSVGIYVTTNPSYVPLVSDFITVTLLNGTATPPLAPLAVAGEIDILFLVGPRGGNLGNSTGLTPGTYQVYCIISTATEDVIRRLDTLTIM